MNKIPIRNRKRASTQKFKRKIKKKIKKVTKFGARRREKRRREQRRKELSSESRTGGKEEGLVGRDGGRDFSTSPKEDLGTVFLQMATLTEVSQWGRRHAVTSEEGTYGCGRRSIRGERVGRDRGCDTLINKKERCNPRPTMSAQSALASQFQFLVVARGVQISDLTLGSI